MKAEANQKKSKTSMIIYYMHNLKHWSTIIIFTKYLHFVRLTSLKLHIFNQYQQFVTCFYTKLTKRILSKQNRTEPHPDHIVLWMGLSEII